MKKRLIAFLLTLVMCVSLAGPASAKIQSGTLDGDGLHVGDTTQPSPPPYIPPITTDPTPPAPTSHEIKTPASTEGGTITVTPKSAVKDTTVTITVTPDEGYELDKLTVTDASGKKIEHVDAGDGKYTFKMPDSTVTIDAAFKKKVPAWVNPFSDVRENDWFYDAVKYVNENGLMVGSDGRFKPNDNLTRAEFAQILYSKEGSPAVTGECKFTDVPANAWYRKQIIWATGKGILAGYGNGKAGPRDSITREQLASLLWRYEGSPAPKSTVLNFSDADKVSGWAKNAMLWAVENGVMSGKSNGGALKLDPKGSATRAECAQMLMNYFSKK